MNKYSNLLFIVGGITLVAGVFGSFALGGALSIGWEFNTSVFVAGTFGSVVLASILLGLGEIINILDDSRNLLKKLIDKPEDSVPNDELPEI